MGLHPTQYYSFNVFTRDEKTLCPLLQTNFLQQNSSKAIYSCFKPCLADYYAFCIFSPLLKCIYYVRLYQVNVLRSNHSSSTCSVPFTQTQ